MSESDVSYSIPVTEDEIREAIGLCSWPHERLTIRRLAYQRDKLICQNQNLRATLDDVRRSLADIIEKKIERVAP